MERGRRRRSTRPPPRRRSPRRHRRRWRSPKRSGRRQREWRGRRPGRARAVTRTAGAPPRRLLGRSARHRLVAAAAPTARHRGSAPIPERGWPWRLAARSGRRRHCPPGAGRPTRRRGAGQRQATAVGARPAGRRRPRQAPTRRRLALRTRTWTWRWPFRLRGKSGLWGGRRPRCPGRSRHRRPHPKTAPPPASRLHVRSGWRGCVPPSPPLRRWPPRRRCPSSISPGISPLRRNASSCRRRGQRREPPAPPTGTASPALPPRADGRGRRRRRHRIDPQSGGGGAAGRPPRWVAVAAEWIRQWGGGAAARVRLLGGDGAAGLARRWRRVRELCRDDPCRRWDAAGSRGRRHPWAASAGRVHEHAPALGDGRGHRDGGRPPRDGRPCRQCPYPGVWRPLPL